MGRQHYRPETFHMCASIGYLQKRAHHLMHEWIERRFAEHNCTLQQWVVLMHVRDGLTATVADLCRKLHHDSGAMTRLVDQLEERKLIKRQRNAEDRRVIELSLTPAGQALLGKLIPIACELLNATLQDFSSEEVKLMQSLLKKMINRLETMREARQAQSSLAREKM
jgi:DNA-binding MarR family transcriptional regulator